MSSFRRETTRAFRWLVLSMMVAGVMAPAASAAVADHLIISEVLIKTRTPYTTFGSPFIEIVNPTGSPIPMDNVYLTDGATSPSTFYYNIALMDPATANPGGGVGGDFHARFPAGYVLAAGDSIAISLNGSTEYQAAYGRNPDFEMFEDGNAPDAVPELREAYQGSINAGLGGSGNVPILSDQAESLVLYSWDGTSDLVQDLDYLMWGANTSSRVDKTGVVIGSGTYLADTAIASQEAAAGGGPTFGSVMRRVDGDEGSETTTGGNGLTGHDETSENLATTFPTVVGHEPPQANPAFPAAPIFTAGGFAPAAPSDGQNVVLTISVVDQDAVDSVSFYYSVDGGADQTLNGTQTSATDWTATVPGQIENSVVNWYCMATNTEETTAIYPAGSPQFAGTWTVGPAVVPGDGPAKLLLTEISTLGTDQEFIEIYNPGTEEVDLTDYYLTDANHSTSGQFYYRIAEGNPTRTSVGGGDFWDFHARFPAGYTIGAGQIIVITVAGSIPFNAEFGFDPDLELWEDDASPDSVPDMLPIFGTPGDDSILGPGDRGTPTLSNSAETVILYHFVSGEDKVTDIDVFAWKDPSSTTVSHFFNKTGVTVGSHSYLPENGTNVNDAFGFENAFGNSYHRTDETEGGQTPTGSNGTGGRDETSENFPTTFESQEYNPGELAWGGPVPDPDKLLITEICTKEAGAEFIEIHNPGARAVDMGDYYLTDAVSSTGNRYYWQIAQGNPSAATVGGGEFDDFHAGFPAGYSLAAGDTITIAVNGSAAFNTAYGFMPDLELFEDDAAADGVLDMTYIFGDATNNSIINRTGTGTGQPSTPDLFDAGETVVLYNWKSGEDRVVDIDVVFWQDSSLTGPDYLFSKTGVTVGAHAYLPETATTAQTPFNSETDPGFSYHRTDGSEGTQTPTGSNGVDGRDETSENFNGTFQMATADPTRPAAPPEPTDAVKLLLTEVCTTGSDQEFVEIHNPSDQTVDLSDYYLTDAIYSSGGQYYWRIAEGNPSQATVGGGAFFDFHARFPEGYTIAAGATIVVSIAGSEAYEGHFEFSPHLELFEDNDLPDNIPDMRWVFGNESANSIYGDDFPGLTNGGETVILYHWVEGADNVTDIDVFAWKDPGYNTTSFFFNKTGQSVGSHSYLAELGTNIDRAYNVQASFGNSYHRTDMTEGSQAPSGSNGVDGRDETSEAFQTTFELLPYDPTPYVPAQKETALQLQVPARTFLPGQGEEFPIFIASSSDNKAETRLRVFDLEGRLVVTLFDSRFNGSPPSELESPANPFLWDGRNDVYERVKAGMYVLHLSSTNIKTGKLENITAPVVVGTRLSN